MDEICSTLVDPSIYSLDVILRTAYKFTDRVYVHLQRDSGGCIEVLMRSKGTGDVGSTLGDFENELIDQRLRDLVAEDTRVTRDLIMAHAFSKVAVINGDLENSEPFSSNGN